MKIVHVVTMLTPENAFGGPVRVAINQLTELSARGHEVQLLASYKGYKSPPRTLQDIPVSAFPAWRAIPGTGFAGMCSPGLLRKASKLAHEIDILHVHMARDLVTLPAAVLAESLNVPVVLQTHGMVDPSTRFLSYPLDYFWTRKTLRNAQVLLYLSPQERANLEAVAGEDLNFSHLPNGVPSGSALADVSGGTDVLFMARLHSTKRPIDFVRAVTRIAPHFPHATFSLVGPDEGEGAEVLRLIAESGVSDRLRWEGALGTEETLNRMRQSAIFVNPRVGDPFPMSVLEASSVGLPVVVSDSCGMARTIEEFRSGLTIGSSVDDLADAISVLLSDAERRVWMGRNAHSMALVEFGMDRISASLIECYERAIERGRGSRSV